MKKFFQTTASILIAILAVNFVATAGILPDGKAKAVSVTFDPATGMGFVGKGDVQLAFGWNDAVLQANAGAVTFTYNSTDTYEAVCTWVTGEGTRGEKTHNVTFNKSTVVTSTIAYGMRTNSQGKVTGFNLNGLGTVTTDGVVPEVGGACLGEGANGTYSSVTPTGSTGGLYVNFETSSVWLQ